MKTMQTKKIMSLLLMGALTVMVPRWAMAVNSYTAACTSISNQATANYTVGGVSQTGITSDAATFTVGNRVSVLATRNDSSPGVSVVPGQSVAQMLSGSEWLSFTVTNNGNAQQDYSLTGIAESGVNDPFGGADDSFDLSGFSVFVESGANAGYQAGEDTATSIDDLNPDASKIVYIVPSGSDPAVPTGLSNGVTAVYGLRATTKKGDGSAESEGSGGIYSGGALQCTTDIVFDDATESGAGPDDTGGAKGSDHSVRDTFYVASAVISVTKASAVYSDPITGTTDGTFTASTWTACSSTCPKAIPGAVIRYKVTVSNASGAASAVLTTIGDTLSGSLIIVNSAAGASWAVTGSSRGTTSGTLTADTNAADGLAHSVSPPTAGGTLTATLTTILGVDGSYAAGELKAGESVTIVFGATIK